MVADSSLKTGACKCTRAMHCRIFKNDRRLHIWKSQKSKRNGPKDVIAEEKEESIGQWMRKQDCRKRTSSFVKNDDYLFNMDDVFVKQRHTSVLTKDNYKDPKDKWVGNELLDACIEWLKDVKKDDEKEDDKVFLSELRTRGS